LDPPSQAEKLITLDSKRVVLTTCSWASRPPSKREREVRAEAEVAAEATEEAVEVAEETEEAVEATEEAAEVTEDNRLPEVDREEEEVPSRTLR
jgi:hypothetical protein